MKIKEITGFKWGWSNRIEEQSIKDGAASDELNVLTKGDHWEVRCGYALFGATRITGAGRIMGLHTGRRPDGTEQPFVARRDSKLEYYDLTTLDQVEIPKISYPTLDHFPKRLPKYIQKLYFWGFQF